MSARDDYPYMADLVRSYGRNVKPENNELVRALAELDLLRVEVADLKAQRDKFREHSIMLNGVAWRLSELLGEVGPDDNVHFGPIDVRGRLDAFAERVTGERDRVLADLLELRTALVKWEQSRLALVRSRTSSDQIRYDDRTVALAALVPARWWGIEETR